jgi:hypothetical protein
MRPPLTSISDAVMSEKGILTHRALSPHQHGETNIHLLLPEVMDATTRDKTLYVLLVEPLDGCGSRSRDQSSGPPGQAPTR